MRDCVGSHNPGGGFKALGISLSLNEYVLGSEYRKVQRKKFSAA